MVPLTDCTVTEKVVSDPSQELSPIAEVFIAKSQLEHLSKSPCKFTYSCLRVCASSHVPLYDNCSQPIEPPASYKIATLQLRSSDSSVIWDSCNSGREQGLCSQREDCR